MVNKWYKQIALNNRLDLLTDAIEYFEQELEHARQECKIKGSLEQAAARLPGIFEYRYAQLQEVEAIYRYLNIELSKVRSGYFRKYLEKYNKQLSSREAEKYIDGEDEIVTLNQLINTVLLVRDQYLGITKSLDQKNWQVSNITKIKVAGLDDAQI